MAQYKSYNNTKRKLETLWNKDKENDDKLFKQLDNQTKSEKKLDKLQEEKQELANIMDISSGWRNLQVIAQTVNEVIVISGSFYEIKIPQILNKLIPSIKVNVVYRVGSSDISSVNEFNDEVNFGKYTTFQIEEIDDDFSSLIISSALVLQDVFPQNMVNDVQVNFLIYLINPNLYQKY